MKCPRCDGVLARTQYGGVNVFVCGQCDGHLIDRKRISAVEKRVNKDLGKLQDEVESAGEFDLAEKVKCPRCHSRMRKMPVRKLDFQTDECMSCKFTWFDGGELAKIQLAYESKPKTQELNRMRDRIENMTEEEREEYERNIQRLVDLGTPMEQATRGAAIELAIYALLRSL